MRKELRCPEGILREVYVPADDPEVQAEDLAPVLELGVGAPATNLVDKLVGKLVRT